LDYLSKVSVWVKLHKVLLEYWTNKGLSYVASALGVPLHAITTLTHKKLTYARVCVEIDALKLLVKEFDLQCPNKMLITTLHVITTLMHKRLTYVRVWVEIDASKLLVKEFDL
jgi:hypothetical protein